jgi:myo-inositol catabolism protein IolC
MKNKKKKVTDLNFENLQNTLSYIQSELNRIETMAGTLSSIETDHFNTLMNFDHSKLQDVAVEEQNAARQLGTIKQMCLSLSQKIEDINQSMQGREFNGSELNETH